MARLSQRLSLSKSDAAAIRKLPAGRGMWVAAQRTTLTLEDGEVDTFVCVDADSGTIRLARAWEKGRGHEPFLQAVVEAMVKPVETQRPGRPKRIGFEDAALCDALGNALEAVGIEVGMVSSEPFDDLFNDMMNLISGPGYLTREGVEPRDVKRFMQLAADLIERAPWEHAADDEMVRIEGLSVSPLLVSILGLAGIEEGLAIFLTEEAAETFLGDGSDEEKMRAPTLHLDIEAEDVGGVLMEATEHGWPIVDPQSVPMLYRLDRMEEGLADAASLALATDVLEVLAHFDPSPRKPVTKKLKIRSRKVRLQWPHAGDLCDDFDIEDEFFLEPVKKKPSKSGKKAPTDVAYQLKVTLDGSNPPIWRRVQIPGHASLSDLHNVLQVAMGWEDCHLYGFDLNEMDEEPDSVALSRFDLGESDEFVYTYDFGDNWDHTVVVEKVVRLEKPLQHAICLDGAGACPPEDCGGIHSYQRRRKRKAADRFDAGAATAVLRKEEIVGCD